MGDSEIINELKRLLAELSENLEETERRIESALDDLNTAMELSPGSQFAVNELIERAERALRGE